MTKDYVNADILHMAEDIRKQADAIQDDEENTEERRFYLYNASAHLLQAFADVTRCPCKAPRGGTKCIVCGGDGGRGGGCCACNGTGRTYYNV